MKKLLGLIGTITIAGSGMAGLVGNAPAKNNINYQQTDNLKNLNRNKRDWLGISAWFDQAGKDIKEAVEGEAKKVELWGDQAGKDIEDWYVKNTLNTVIILSPATEKIQECSNTKTAVEIATGAAAGAAGGSTGGPLGTVVGATVGVVGAVGNCIIQKSF